MRKASLNPQAGSRIVSEETCFEWIDHGTSMRRKGEMIGKLGELYFAIVFSGLGGFRGGAGLDKEMGTDRSHPRHIGPGRYVTRRL